DQDHPVRQQQFRCPVDDPGGEDGGGEVGAGLEGAVPGHSLASVNRRDSKPPTPPRSTGSPRAKAGGVGKETGEGGERRSPSPAGPPLVRKPTGQTRRSPTSGSVTSYMRRRSATVTASPTRTPATQRQSPTPKGSAATHARSDSPSVSPPRTRPSRSGSREGPHQRRTGRRSRSALRCFSAVG